MRCTKLEGREWKVESRGMLPGATAAPSAVLERGQRRGRLFGISAWQLAAASHPASVMTFAVAVAVRAPRTARGCRCCFQHQRCAILQPRPTAWVCGRHENLSSERAQSPFQVPRFLVVLGSIDVRALRNGLSPWNHNPHRALGRPGRKKRGLRAASGYWPHSTLSNCESGSVGVLHSVPLETSAGEEPGLSSMGRHLSAV